MPPRIIKVYSKDNHFQRAEVLKRNREKRTRYAEFLVEGVRAINAALTYRWEIGSFLYSSERPLSSWAQDILAQSSAAYHLDLKLSLLEELSDKEETSELLALVRCRTDDLARIPRSPAMVVVVFDRPVSPGNLGSSLRSCDALGACGVIITGHAADLYDPQTVRSSTGSSFAIPAVRLESASEVASWVSSLADEGIEMQIVGTDEQGSATLDSFDFTKPTLLIMGNETSGMAAAYREMCTALLKIPMCGSASSLNVSCAASIALYEVLRQRAAGAAR